MPEVVDHVAVARLYGEPLFSLPTDLYIPPDALEVFLEAFEGPLDLLLYLIRKQNFNILDIPMAGVTRQYLSYVEEIRTRNLELAAEYLLMAAMLIEIKSRMLLPPRKKVAEGQEPEDPRAELVRRLLEYEQMKLAAAQLNGLPQAGRDFLRAQVHDRTVAASALSRRSTDRPAGGLARHPQARPAGAAPQDQPRRAQRARAHEPRAAQAAGPAFHRIRSLVRPGQGASRCWW
jgi:chromatin segregation and condensation protein Rec8/ScpA/Scc1 (kleisin family)